MAAIVVAALGWVLTFVAGTFLAQPDTIEDLTPAWTAAGATPLGDSRMVAVPPGQTLVAFLVAIPTRTGALPRNPWFQRWGWLAMGTLGVLACALGVARAR